MIFPKQRTMINSLNVKNIFPTNEFDCIRNFIKSRVTVLLSTNHGYIYVFWFIQLFCYLEKDALKKRPYNVNILWNTN